MNAARRVIGALLAVATLAVPFGPTGSHAAAGRASSQLADVRYIYHGLAVQPPNKGFGHGIKKMPLYSQYFLRTGHGEKASIGFHDGTVVHMNQQTDAVLASPHLTQVKKGEVAEYLAPGTDHKVQTASAVAAAIGTAYDVRTDGTASVFVVLHGALRVQNASGAVVVKSNFQTTVVPNAPPAKPTPADARAVFAWTQGIPTPDLGEDIALDASGGSVVGFSSERTDARDAGRARYINDGLLSSGWQSGSGQVSNQWVKLGFFGGIAYRIAGVIIDPAATFGDPATADLKDFEIRISSTDTRESSFTTVLRATCKQEDSLQRFFFPVPVRARYVELVALNNYGDPTHVDVAEMEVVATSSLFAQPRGIASDKVGNLYISDTVSNRVARLSPAGKVLKSWGSKGRAPGQFVSPYGVAVDRAGNIYVADSSNDRVQKFSPQGKALAVIGSSGLDPGQFIAPMAVAIDAAGNIWVTDSLRVQKLSPDGRPLDVWTDDGVSQAFSFPQGLALDRAGNVWVADTGNDRVLKMSPSGDLLAEITLRGTDYGQIHGPVGIAFDPDGNAYIAASGDSRLVKVGPDGKPITGWGTLGKKAGQFLLPMGVAVTPQGRVYVTDPYQGRIERFSLIGKFQAAIGKFATVPQVLGEPGGLAVDTRGDVYVTDHINHRLQTRTTSGGVRAVQGYYGFVLLEKGTKGLGQFYGPHGVAVDRQGAIYVADTNNFRIQILSNRGPIGAFGTKGTAPGQFLLPYGVAVDAAGNIYVDDWGNSRIQKFSPNGKKVLWVSGSYGSGDGQFALPEGIAVDGRGNVYVADTYNDRIVKLSAATGKVLAVWGTAGHNFSDRFNFPDAVAVDKSGDVYVCDSGHQSIQKLSPSGVLLDEFYLPGPGPIPNSVAVDSKGNIYVGLGLNSRIIKLSATGAVLSIWD